MLFAVSELVAVADAGGCPFAMEELFKGINLTVVSFLKTWGTGLWESSATAGNPITDDSLLPPPLAIDTDGRRLFKAGCAAREEEGVLSRL